MILNIVLILAVALVFVYLVYSRSRKNSRCWWSNIYFTKDDWVYQEKTWWNHKNKFIWFRANRRRIKKKKKQEVWIKKGFERLYIWRC